MRFPGTISISDTTFKNLLEATGRSLRQAGFTSIVLIGDHGGYQGLLREVAAQLNREWTKTSARAYFIEDYYRVTQTAYVEALRAKGLSDAEIGSHAGVADTSLTLAIEPDLVRTDRLGGAQNNAANGVLGDPRASTAALGQIGVDLIVTQTVAAIRKARLRQH
jgi:creatinine amidohydrolase